MNTVTEWFMVHDQLWASVGLREHDATLCVGCFEKLLGRTLLPNDFSATETNEPHEIMSSRLLNRMGMRKVLVDTAGKVVDQEVPDVQPPPDPRIPPLIPEDERWFGAERAAEYLGVPTAVVFRLARDRRIAARWHPLRVERYELYAYLAGAT